MSTKQANEAAAQYLKKQAEIIGKYGKAPRLSGDRYKEALADTRKTFQAISSQQQK